MHNDQKILKKMAPILVYGRPPLVFAGMICAMAVMLNREPVLYLAGILLFFISTVFDLVDGWFAVRFLPNTTLAQLADRMMNRVVYSIVFPLLAVGMMWRLVIVAPDHSRIQLLHAIVVLILCVTVLVRDNFAHFMRRYGERSGQEPELRELNRLRTIVAAPLGLLLYIYAFFVPAAGEPGLFYSLIDRLGHLPVRDLFIIEILFLIINFASIAGYCRKYGSYFLDDLCMDDNLLRRRILSVFPNALTLMNAIMGLLAVFFAAQGKMTESYLLIMGAAVFDKLDGAMARKLGLTEPPLDACNTGGITFGGLLDDIADGVSFCIAPGWIAYLCLSLHPAPEIRALPLGIAAVIYILAGFARLVYFTRDPNPIPGIFKGLPTPAAALFVTAPLIIIGQADGLAGQWDIMVGYLAFGLLFFSAFLMNLYPVRYIHMGRFMDRNPWFARTTIVLTIVFVFTPFFGYFAFLLMFFYLLSPLLTRRMDPAEAARESRT